MDNCACAVVACVWPPLVAWGASSCSVVSTSSAEGLAGLRGRERLNAQRKLTYSYCTPPLCFFEGLPVNGFLSGDRCIDDFGALE